MLPSPDHSPEPSATVETPVSDGDPPRYRTPEPTSETEGARPDAVGLRDEVDNEEQDISGHRNDEQGLLRHATDEVPIGLAKMMVNMHEHYNTELEKEKERNARLREHQEEMQRKMDEMEMRLQTHVILMEGFVSFMTQVREGRLATPVAPEVAIAETLGPEHSEMVQRLIEHPQQSFEEVPEDMVASSPTEVEEDIEPCGEALELNRQLDEMVQQMDIPDPHIVREAWADLNQLPPTPDMDTAPIRSTGIRATKRRNPFSSSARKPKRRTAAPRRRRNSWEVEDDEEEEASEEEYRPLRSRLRYRSLDVQVADEEGVSEEVDVPASEPEEVLESSRPLRRTRWRAVNVVDELVDEEPEMQGDESDYEPRQADQDDHHSMSSDSRSPSPVPSSLFEGFHTPEPPSPHSSHPPPTTSPPSTKSPPAKPRYATPRKTGYRYASGPPSRPFRYHRMPKTVALIWREWKHGLHGNPAIGALEEQYGTGWRTGSLGDRKYASNYVGVRQKIIRKVEELCESEGLGEEEVCRLLDERVEGRIQVLQHAIHNNEDPLTSIPKRVVS